MPVTNGNRWEKDRVVHFSQSGLFLPVSLELASQPGDNCHKDIGMIKQ